MNRRELLRGSAALWAGLPISLVWASCMGAGSERDHWAAEAPVELDLYGGAVESEAGARRFMASVSEATEREAWMQVPDDLRAAMVKRADAWKGKDWPSLLATTALDFKRNGIARGTSRHSLDGGTGLSILCWAGTASSAMAAISTKLRTGSG